MIFVLQFKPQRQKKIRNEYLITNVRTDTFWNENRIVCTCRWSALSLEPGRPLQLWTTRYSAGPRRRSCCGRWWWRQWSWWWTGWWLWCRRCQTVNPRLVLSLSSCKWHQRRAMWLPLWHINRQTLLFQSNHLLALIDLARMLLYLKND